MWDKRFDDRRVAGDEEGSDGWQNDVGWGVAKREVQSVGGAMRARGGEPIVKHGLNSSAVATSMVRVKPMETTHGTIRSGARAEMHRIVQRLSAGATVSPRREDVKDAVTAGSGSRQQRSYKNRTIIVYCRRKRSS